MGKHLVFGSGGQIGGELLAVLKERGEDVEGADRSRCDITRAEAVFALVRELKPDVVYNAAGFTDIDQAESLPDRARQVNAIGAGLVAAAAEDVGAQLVHLSSYLVFGDGHHSPIDETQQPAPMSVFGHTKLFGEQLVQRNSSKAFVIRTSAVYSTHGQNFVRQMIGLAMSKKSLTLIDDEIIAPTPAFLVAQVAIDLARDDVPYGVYHVASHRGCSWYDFGKAFLDKLDMEVEIHPTTQVRWGAPAPRPTYGLLDNMMLRGLRRDTLSTWEECLDSFLEQYGERLVWELS